MDKTMEQTQEPAYRFTISRKGLLKLAQNRYEGFDVVDWDPRRFSGRSLKNHPNAIFDSFLNAFRRAHPQRLHVSRAEDSIKLTVRMPLDLGLDFRVDFKLMLHPERGLLSLCYEGVEAVRDWRHTPQPMYCLPRTLTFFMPLPDAEKLGIITRV